MILIYIEFLFIYIRKIIVEINYIIQIIWKLFIKIKLIALLKKLFLNLFCKYFTLYRNKIHTNQTLIDLDIKSSRFKCVYNLQN